MKFSNLLVKNFRALKEINIPLSNFGCLIGENNSGKSSVLQAILYFHSGASLPKSYWHDDSQNIRIEILFTEIRDADLNRLEQGHREKIRNIIKNNSLKLARVYTIDGKSNLIYVGLVPKDERFSKEKLDNLIKSKKPGESFTMEILAAFPELEGKIDNKTNQTMALEAINFLIKDLNDVYLEEKDIPLPTGLDKSIYSLFPEPIYIPAVKDLGDEIKIKESTSFGKIFRILLDKILEDLRGEDNLFNQLDWKLNPIVLENGQLDNSKRIPQLVEIEYRVQKFLQESFRNVKIKIYIPPPEIKSILSNAQIFADDGVNGLVDSKGDGLRRSVVFSILRTYAELRKAQESENKDNDFDNNYLLLFEEPELFLHPHAQLILFDALKEFSARNTVIVTTHSPAFFNADATTIFIKLYKELEQGKFSQALAIDLSDMKDKDHFQIICYENNNAAFFANTVVLVEGDSDLIILPHIAKILNPSWDTIRHSIQFAKINGKSSIARYKQFFGKFNVRTVVIADLDLIVSDFDKIDPTQELIRERSVLLSFIDKALEGKKENDLSSDKAYELKKSISLKVLCTRMLASLKKASVDHSLISEAEKASSDFFNFVRKDDRISVLKELNDPEFLKLKRSFLSKLREKDIYILERGTIESYYPENIIGSDKPTKAQCFCKIVKTKEVLLDLCLDHDGFEYKGCSKEFSLILGPIFEPITI